METENEERKKMIQKFIVAIDAEDSITAKEVEDAIELGHGPFSLDSLHNEIIVAKVRKICSDMEVKIIRNNKM